MMMETYIADDSLYNFRPELVISIANRNGVCLRRHRACFACWRGAC